MKPPAWSFSSIKAYLTCPSRYVKIRVLKEFKEEYTPDTDYGDDFHKAIENYLKHGPDVAPLPTRFSQHQEYADKWRAIAATGGAALYVEHEMALNRKLQPCEWFGRQVFSRAKADVIVVSGSYAFAGDHKTGKRRLFEELDQMMVTALHVFYYFPKVDTVKTGYFWLREKGKSDKNTFYRHDIPKMWNILLPLLKDYKRAFNEDNFPPRQSGLCAGYCPVTSCKFWSPKRQR